MVKKTLYPDFVHNLEEIVDLVDVVAYFFEEIVHVDIKLDIL